MEGNNSKVLLAGGIVVGLVVVILAMRGLTADRERPVRDTDSTVVQNEDGAEDSATGERQRTGSRVTAMDSTEDNRQRPTTGRGPRPTSVQPIESSSTGPLLAATPEAAPANLALADANTTALNPDSAEAKENARKVADLASLFKNEQDPDARIDIADDLGMIDDPASVRQILELLNTETDPEVRESLLNALTGLEALEQMGEQTVAALDRLILNSSEVDVRIAAQDVMGDIATAQSASSLQRMYQDPNSDPRERLNAGENLLRLRTNEPSLVPDELAAKVNEQLKLDFQAGTDPAFRSQAVMALAIGGRQNLPFFQQALQSEQDPNVKALLEKLVRMYTMNP